VFEGQQFIAEPAGPSFRGNFLQCCAEIEDHLCLALERLVELQEIKRPPYLFGQKFDRVLKSVARPGLWQHKAHVESVLLELQPLIELRGMLGHALIRPAMIGDEPGLLFQIPGERDWKSRRAITQSEMTKLLTDLRRLTDKFLKQRLVAGP
jgi:hypothetical protein